MISICFAAVLFPPSSATLEPGYLTLEDLCVTLSHVGCPIVPDASCSEIVYGVVLNGAAPEEVLAALLSDAALTATTVGGTIHLKRNPGTSDSRLKALKRLISSSLRDQEQPLIEARAKLDGIYSLDTTSVSQEFGRYFTLPISTPAETIVRAYIRRGLSYGGIALGPQVIHTARANPFVFDSYRPLESYAADIAPVHERNGVRGRFGLDQSSPPGDLAPQLLPLPDDKPADLRSKADFARAHSARLEFRVDPLAGVLVWSLMSPVPFRSLAHRPYSPSPVLPIVTGSVRCPSLLAAPPKGALGLRPALDVQFTLASLRTSGAKGAEVRVSLSDLILLSYAKNRKSLVFKPGSFNDFVLRMPGRAKVGDYLDRLEDPKIIAGEIAALSTMRVGSSFQENRSPALQARPMVDASRFVHTLWNPLTLYEPLSRGPILSVDVANERLHGRVTKVASVMSVVAAMRFGNPDRFPLASNEALSWCIPSRLKPFADLYQGSTAFRSLVDGVERNGERGSLRLSDLTPREVRILESGFERVRGQVARGSGRGVTSELAIARSRSEDLQGLELTVSRTDADEGLELDLAWDGFTYWNAIVITS